MAYFEKLPQLVDLRGKTKHNGAYKVYNVSVKTDIAIHHSLTTDGSSAAFANYHVGYHDKNGRLIGNGWPAVAYHFVILKNGAIEWNQELGALTYHVGNSNKFAVGICLVGDFRTEEPTEAQKRSLFALHNALKRDLPNYMRTRGHNEFPGYAWKACPEFDYRAVVSGVGFDTVTKIADLYWGDSVLAKGQVGRLTIVKRINLWRREANDKLTLERILEPGEVYRVYGFDEKHGGQYNVGGGCWVTNMDGYIKYEVYGG